MKQYHDRQAVELIEEAHDAELFCACGRLTVPVGREGAVWLECRSLQEQPSGRFARLRGAIATWTHTRSLILEAPATAA